MNKNAIQKFAIWARNELIAQVSQRAYQYGIDESGFGDASADTLNGRPLTAEEKSQRQELIKRIKEKGYQQVMEAVAYTWFNRFIALRFMEVNNYLPSHIRVFSDASGAFKPEILNDVLHLDLPGLDSGKVAEYIESNDTEGLYRYLLLTQCNALNSALPVMFERMGGYTEMLLPNNILRQDSVLGHMVSDIPEENWQDAVQIIGWLYQYYNTELKDDTFAQLKKNVKITKERIPAATQLFTPDWIVRYMVENSLGRLWLEGHPNAALHVGWKYYLDEAEQEPEVEAQLAKLREEYKTIKPEEIKVIDPCMGSGHILVYAFDVLMQIYTSAGWDQRKAAQSILKNNLYGLDIDDRAAQLAYFAVMMKARQYDRRFLNHKIQPHVYAIAESGHTDKDGKRHKNYDEYTLAYFCNGDAKLKKAMDTIISELHDAKEYGSILTVTPQDWSALYARFAEIKEDIHISREAALRELLPLVQTAQALLQKYDVVVTNPPYMGASGMNARLSQHVKDYFPDTKADLFSCFIERGFQFANVQGFVSMITMESWMFLSSFEKMRQNIVNTHTIVNMVHMPYLGKGGTSLGINFGTAAVIFNKRYCRDYNSQFDYICYYETDENGVPFAFPTVNERYKATKATSFSKIPGSPVAYWIDEKTILLFSTERSLGCYVTTKVGLQSGDTDRFVRFWHEPQKDKESVFSQLEACKWYPIVKGGDFRKWYGNDYYVVNWEMDGKAIKQCKGARPQNIEFYFKEAVVCPAITSAIVGYRYCPSGKIFDVNYRCTFCNKDMINYILGFLNSKVVTFFSDILSPTMALNVNDLLRIPLIYKDNLSCQTVVKDSVALSNKDWNSYEISWDFKRNPLV